MSIIKKRSVGFVGIGNVGMAAAYAFFLKGLAGEIVLVDKDRRRAEGEAMDLLHGQMFVENVNVRAGGFSDLGSAQLIVISAGVGQKPNESRLNLLNRNVDVMREITTQLDRYAPEAVLIIASNPVDIMTYIVQELTQRPQSRVIGTGTLLDTGRFRALLGKHYRVDPKSVHAYILGEHGDSEVPIWSSATIGGQLVYNTTVLGIPFDAAKMEKLFLEVRNAAYEIIDRKGYTNTAIGAGIAKLAKVIIDDQKSVLPISIRLTGQYELEDVCLSLPCVLGRNGIEAMIFPELNQTELTGLRNSAAVLKANMDGLEI